jgi:hypothetical protein
MKTRIRVACRAILGPAAIARTLSPASAAA